MTRFHYFTLLVLIVFLAVMSGWIFESIDKQPEFSKEKLRHDPDYFFKNFTATTMDKNGLPTYQLKASFLQHFPDDDSIELHQPLFYFYDNNEITWTAKASNAWITDNSKIINMKGNVVLQQVVKPGNKTTALKLTAEQLTIEQENKLAHTNSEVKLLKGEDFIHSQGFKADLLKNRIEFLSRTRSHYVLPAK